MALMSFKFNLIFRILIISGLLTQSIGKALGDERNTAVEEEVGWKNTGENPQSMDQIRKDPARFSLGRLKRSVDSGDDEESEETDCITLSPEPPSSSSMPENSPTNLMTLLNNGSAFMTDDDDDIPQDVILVLGNTGSGKTTLTQIIAGDLSKLHSVRIEGGSAFVIIDDDHRIGAPSTISKTLFPELVLGENGTALYDCPGFDDTRGPEQDIATNYFMNQIIMKAHRLKLLFLVIHSSVTPGRDRVDFDVLVSHATKFLKNIPNYRNSIGLVVTKVSSYSDGGKFLKDQLILKGIVQFLTMYLSNLRFQLGATAKPELQSELERKIEFVEILLEQNGSSKYHHISFSRSPTECGSLSESKLIAETKRRVTQFYSEDLDYALVNHEDFGFTLKDKTKLELGNFVMALNEDVTKGMATLMRSFMEWHSGKILNAPELIDKLTRIQNSTATLEEFLASWRNGGNQSSNPETAISSLTTFLEVIGFTIPPKDQRHFKQQQSYFAFFDQVNEASVARARMEWIAPVEEAVTELNRDLNEFKPSLRTFVESITQKVENELLLIMEGFESWFMEKHLQTSDLRAKVKEVETVTSEVGGAISELEGPDNNLEDLMRILNPAILRLGYNISGNLQEHNMEEHQRYLELDAELNPPDIEPPAKQWMAPLTEMHKMFLDLEEKLRLSLTIFELNEKVGRLEKGLNRLTAEIKLIREDQKNILREKDLNISTLQLELDVCKNLVSDLKDDVIAGNDADDVDLLREQPEVVANETATKPSNFQSELDVSMASASDLDCPPGFKASAKNPKECEAIKECPAFNVCSQLCDNSTGSFVCSCIDGFRVGERDNQSCQANDPNWKLLFASRQEIEYTSQMELEQLGKFRVSSSPGRPVAVTYVARGGTVYWTDASPNSEGIYRKSLLNGNGSVEVIVDTGIVLPEGIAFDWITGNVYFADSNLSHIVVCGNNTNLCSILVQQLDQPRDIALHPNKGIMLWTDWGTNASISRVGMDGSFPTQIVTTDIKWPNGITIDQGSDRVYWVDAGLDKIETMLLDGRDRHVVISIRNSHPFGVDVFGDRIFWSDWNNFNIKSAHKLTGAGRKIHVSDSGNLMNGLAVYHVANQPIRRYNPCRTSGCSHICTLSDLNDFRCLCPVGMVLDTDQKTCVDPNDSEKLAIAFKNMIKVMRFDSIGRDVFQSIPFPQFKTISAVVYNPVNNTIIFSDSGSFPNIIYGYNVDTERLSILINKQLHSVRGMDIDVVAENLYWVDSGKQTVEVMSLRTSARKVLMTGVKNANDVVVAPKLGSLFVAAGGNILKMFMNGKNSTIFQSLGEKEPIGLAYDRELETLVWADKVNRGVEMISLDGKSISVPITNQSSPPSDAIKHGKRLYWAEMSSAELKYLTLGTPDVRSTRFGSTEANFSLTLSTEEDNQTQFHPKITVINRDISYLDMLLEQHECSRKNPKRKQCSHACLLTGADLVGECFCPEGFSLNEDGITCDKLSSCFDESYFQCDSGRCILTAWRCDNDIDCPGDGADERGCNKFTCHPDHFMCANGKCIKSEWVCDKEEDCEGGSDEMQNCDDTIVN